MINCVKYEKKGVRKCSISSLNTNSRRFWVDVNKPEKKDLNKISKLFNISLRNLQDSLDIKEVPRVVSRRNYCFIVLRAPGKIGRTIPIGIFIGKNYIITVHPNQINSVDKFFKVCSTAEGSEFFESGTTYLLYRIISEFIREFSTDLEKMSDKLNKLEDKILKNEEKDDNKLFSIKRNFLFIKRAIRSNMAAIKNLEGNKFNFIDADSFKGELLVEATQVEHMADIYDEKLVGALDMYMSSVSNRLNDIMKSFGVVASLILIPTLISGIWGMNFAKIPFFDNQYGFYVPIGIMVLSVTLMLIFFRWKKWI